MRKFQEQMNAAATGAAKKLADLVAYSGEDCEDIATAIVEQVMEAAVRRVYLELEREGARRKRAEAYQVLCGDLCGDCQELLAPEERKQVAEEDGRPGAIELAERALFLGWHQKVLELPLERDKVGGLAEDSPRMHLIEDIHADMGNRFPLGIAESLAQVISALHAGDDQDALMVLADLAAAEEAAARLEKTEACLGALRTLVDPEVSEDLAREQMAGWTLEELDQVLEWAEVAFGSAVAEAAIPAKPAVVAAFERSLEA